MTCIAGVIDNGKVWIGGDSAGVNSEENLQLRKDSKVFRTGEFLIGVAGSWRAAQEIRFTHFPSSPVDGSNVFEHMVTKFLPALRNIRLTDHFELLVGFHGRLFHIYGTSQVSEEIADYEACGSGAQVARGALHTLHHMPEAVGFKACEFFTPEIQVRWALVAAERFCSGVRGPFNVLSI